DSAGQCSGGFPRGYEGYPGRRRLRRPADLSTVSLALTLRRTQPLSVRRWPPLLVLYGTIFPAAALLTTVAFWPMWQDRPLLALGDEFLSVALLASGILLLVEPGRARPALMQVGLSAMTMGGD